MATHRLIVLSVATLLALLSGCTKKKSIEPTQVDLVQKYEETIKKSPSFENFISYGLELHKLKRFDDAMIAYKNAKAINPDAPLAWNNICSLYNEIGRFGDAVENCEKALELEPAFELAKNNLNIAKNKINEIKIDIKSRKSSLLANASSSAEYLDLGMTFYNVRELKTAIEIWGKIKDKSDSFYASAQNNIGSAYILLKQLGRAEEAIQSALKIDPSNELYLNNKKWLEDEKNKK